MDVSSFWLCFVPLFVAVDPIGILPLYMGMTEGVPRPQQRQIIGQSVVTAMLVAMAFLLVGRGAFRLLGITMDDFMIAGGALLFALAMSDLVSTRKGRRQVSNETFGAVPIGVPLMVGPAVLTTILLLNDLHGAPCTLLATLANLSLAGVILAFSHHVERVLGRNGIRVFSKIVSLILAAIAVMMIRTGVVAIIRNPPG